jgi:hypothetical protein
MADRYTHFTNLAYTGKIAHGGKGSEVPLFTGWDKTNTDITVGAESSSVVNVAVQFKDRADADMTTPVYTTIYFTDDAAGQTLPTALDSVAIGTDGTIVKEVTAGILYETVSEADGDLDLDLTQDAADTLYMHIVCPDGSLKTSSVITFTAA